SRSLRSWSALLIAGALAVAACGGDDDDAVTEESDAAVETTSGAPAGPDTADDEAVATTEAPAGTRAEATDETDGTTAAGDYGPGSATTFPQPEGEPDLDASFVYGYPITVSRLDPHRASISQDATTLFPVYDRLVHLSPTGDLIPGLAESWEFSDDGLTLTLHVRPDVTFHDGAALDAEAVKANLDRGKSIEGSSVATDLAAMESVTVVDPMTVEVTLSTPNVAIIGSFADRAGVIVSPQALADGVDLDANMVGAGPYKMLSHVHGDSTKYERNDDYWDQEHLAPVKNLEIKVIADNVARLNAIRTGQISATTISASQTPEVEGNEDLRLMYNTELAYTYIVQNRARGGQDDLRVRQAMLHALDREAICESLLAGKCELTDQPFPPGYFAYNEDIPDVLYPYDPEKAKELMAEAGVTSLSLSMLIPAGLPTFPEIAEIIQAQWAEIGITIDIRPTDPTSLGELMFAQEQADTMLAGWGGRPDPAMTFIQRAGPDAFANPGGLTTPEMEELIAQATSIADPEERAAALKEGSREMAESVLEMVVLFPQVPYVAQSNVRFTPYLSSKPEFRDVAIIQD
ncbi:MAG TPA: ABC transporter substrate-binding protein, partial [Ilumatobacteraceae bacterium]|nr:ABC transporter substrate-binding protein [Ilumatobacteraceae bacterium]